MYSILVVDDEAELRKQIVSILKDRGYEVDEAVDGLDAAEKLAQKPYPLVLCDVRMPRMTGQEFLKHVLDNEYSTAVALITAHGNIRDAIDATRRDRVDQVEIVRGDLVRVLDPDQVLAEAGEHRPDAVGAVGLGGYERRLGILTGHELADGALCESEARQAITQPAVAGHPEEDPSHRSSRIAREKGVGRAVLNHGGIGIR